MLQNYSYYIPIILRWWQYYKKKNIQKWNIMWQYSLNEKDVIVIRGRVERTLITNMSIFTFRAIAYYRDWKWIVLYESLLIFCVTAFSSVLYFIMKVFSTNRVLHCILYEYLYFTRKTSDIVILPASLTAIIYILHTFCWLFSRWSL